MVFLCCMHVSPVLCVVPRVALLCMFCLHGCVSVFVFLFVMCLVCLDACRVVLSFVVCCRVFRYVLVLCCIV